jgi:hypothetical protein
MTNYRNFSVSILILNIGNITYIYIDFETVVKIVLSDVKKVLCTSICFFYILYVIFWNFFFEIIFQLHVSLCYILCTMREIIERDGMTCGNDKIDLKNKLNVNVGFFTVENSNLMLIFHTILVNINLYFPRRYLCLFRGFLLIVSQQRLIFTDVE